VFISAAANEIDGCVRDPDNSRPMNIVIATDGNEAARHAIAEALRLLPLSSPAAHVTLVSVLDPELRLGGNVDAQQDLDSGKAVIEKAGVRCSTSLRQGTFAEQIVAAGHELKADVIVLGSQKKSKLTRALLGSVAVDVMTKWTGAVLVVKHED
jgi:nucleotide-binding universal stress UspA family protein